MSANFETHDESRDALADLDIESEAETTASRSNTSLGSNSSSSYESWKGPSSSFSLELPKIKRKKFPYYPYGLIIPKCKPLKGKGKVQSKKKNANCIDNKGPWTEALKDFYQTANEIEEDDEDEENEEEEEEETAKPVTVIQSAQSSKKMKIRKTIAQADSKMKFKMAEIQNLYA